MLLKRYKNKREKLSYIEKILDSYSKDELFNFTDKDILNLVGISKLASLYNRKVVMELLDSLYITGGSDILVLDVYSITEALKLLPEFEKKAIVLLLYELLTDDEVCEVLEVDIRDLYKLLFLASLRLRAWYRRQKYKSIIASNVARESFSNLNTDHKKEINKAIGIIANKRFKNKSNLYIKIFKVKSNLFLATTRKNIKILYEFSNEKIDILDISYSVRSL